MDTAVLIKLALQAGREFVFPLVRDLLGPNADELSDAAYAAIDPIVQEMVQTAYSLGLERVTYDFAKPYLFHISKALRDAGFSEVSP